MPTVADFGAHWKKVLSVPGRQGVDIIASLDEEVLNQFLAKHFEYDNERYKLGFKQTFDDHGTERVFTLSVEARRPFHIVLPPFWPLRAEAPMKRSFFEAKTGWVSTGSEARHLPLLAQNKDSTDPSNVFLGCPEMMFVLTWPNLSGGKDWKFDLGPLAVGATAVLSLEHQIEPENPPRDVSFLRITPTAIRFDISPQRLADRALRSLQSSRNSQLKSLADDQGFRDLLVIALNIACTMYAPKMVQDIKLPSPTLLNQTITVSMVDVSDKFLTVGSTIDRQAFAEQKQSDLHSMLKELDVALAADIDAQGGLQAIADEQLAASRPVSASTLLTQLPRTNAFIRSLQQLSPSPSRQRRSRAAVTGQGGAIGINAHLLTALVRDILPEPKADCTGWLDLALVRGRLCWWARLFDPNVQITEVSRKPQVDGSIAVDVGGAIEACIRRFWDCTWRWECGRATLSLNGPFGVALALKDSSQGVAFSGKISRTPNVETNLPFPFDVVVKAVGGIILAAIVAFVNAVLSLVTIVIVPPDLVLPGQRTGLQLEDFAAFYFKRSASGVPAGTPEGRLTFAAYGCNITPKKMKSPSLLTQLVPLSQPDARSRCRC